MAMAETVREKIREIEPARSVFDIKRCRSVSTTRLQKSAATVLLSFSPRQPFPLLASVSTERSAIP